VFRFYFRCRIYRKAIADLISQALIDKVSAGPAKSKVDEAKKLRARVESALGSTYRVFLQGSYRNRTGTAKLNDVDIVALAKTVRSTRGGPPATNPISWEEIFQRVEDALDADWMFTGLVSRGDKCVKVDTDLSLDVVPAIHTGVEESDPVSIYSFREGRSRDNYPRDHFDAGVDKNGILRTDGAFKPTVRMLKLWAKNVLGDPQIAPSFYVECAAHEVADEHFDESLPLSFLGVGLEICSWSTTKVINSVAGDKDILVPSEWHPERFEDFKSALFPSLKLALEAVQATSNAAADLAWRETFNV
jgi:hypothetical protein